LTPSADGENPSLELGRIDKSQKFGKVSFFRWASGVHEQHNLYLWWLKTIEKILDELHSAMIESRHHRRD
jgi:hypothetical protein